MIQCLRILYFISFHKKSLKESMNMETKLNRCINLPQLILYGFGSMIGIGIYVLSGHLIKTIVGPAISLSFLLSGIICIFTAMCYCEFGTLIPKTGSCYTYTYILIGELPAFLLGWTLIMDIIISISGITKGFSGAINILTDNKVVNFTKTYLPITPNSKIWESSLDIVSLALVITIILVSLSNAEFSFNLNAFLTSVQLAMLLSIIIACFVYGSVENLHKDGGFFTYGFNGVIKGAGIGIFAFSGFESVANAAEEVINPKRSILIAIYTILTVMVILYMIGSTGLAYLVPRLLIDEKSPFVAGFERIGAVSFKYISGIGVILATGATKVTSFYYYPRLFYALANDGLIFQFLGRVNKYTKTPLIALLFGGIIIIVLVGFVRIQALVDVTTMGLLISYTVIGIDLLILRYIYDEENSDDINLEMRIKSVNFLAKKSYFKGLIWSLVLNTIFGAVAFFIIVPKIALMGYILTGIFSALTLITFITMCFYTPKKVNHIFTTPFMPLPPTISILSNIVLLVNLKIEVFVRFIIWMLVGLLIYVLYGLQAGRFSDLKELYFKLHKDDNTSSNEKENVD